MKRKRLAISLIFVLCFIIVVFVGIKNKVNINGPKENNEHNYFQVEEVASTKFKGASSISNEQKIMIDKSQGEIKNISVQDKQKVEKGTVLFTYYNADTDEQVKELDRQINNINSKSKKQNKEEQGGEELKESLNELKVKREGLKKKVSKPITAEFDGIVYIDDNGKNDSTKEYIKVVSQEPLVVSEASEFDVESLKVDEPVQIKVISTGEKINGKIVKIADLPTIGEDKKSVGYKVNIKPEKGIRIGFNVEVAINPQKIKIPKKYVTVEDKKTFVNRLDEGDSSKKVEIKGTLDGENYILEDESIKPGDKLSERPLEESGGGK